MSFCCYAKRSYRHFWRGDSVGFCGHNKKKIVEIRVFIAEKIEFENSVINDKLQWHYEWQCNDNWFFVFSYVIWCVGQYFEYNYRLIPFHKSYGGWFRWKFKRYLQNVSSKVPVFVRNDVSWVPIDENGFIFEIGETSFQPILKISKILVDFKRNDWNRF